MEERTEGKHDRGTNIILFFIPQIDALLEEIDLQIGPWTRRKKWLRTIDPSDYKGCYNKIAERYRNSGSRITAKQSAAKQTASV